MFEYWIYEEFTKEQLQMATGITIDFFPEGKICLKGDAVWFFQCKNLFVIRSDYPFEDGNSLLDKILVRLALAYSIHDKGIKRSCWDSSSFK